ncbi:MAG: zinc-dependent peptidase [Bacteroidia bacterium]|nr:zinc-dependent peptidase [Bacteroidia bacterium]
MKPDLFFNTWDPFLYDYHLYYRNLSKEGKLRFISRVKSVYQNAIILGKEGLKINEQIKILILSNLVQLTFGLKQFWLYGYEYIYLYPDSFFDEATGQTVKGSTYNDKIISLSWKDFALDHLRAKDGTNVSFMQYALALVRTVLNGKKFDLSFGSYLDNWFEIIKRETALKSNINKADATMDSNDDLAIVFAKCTEMFFERPEIFKKDLPTSYAHFCLLMNQDPLNITEDYKYERARFNKNNVKELLPFFIPKNYKYKTWHWSYNLPFFGFAICPVILYFLIDKVLVTPFQLIFTIVAIALIISLIFYSNLHKAGLFNNSILFMTNCLIGVAPCTITAYIFINSLYGYAFTSKITRHKIASFYRFETSWSTGGLSTTFNYSDAFLIDYPKARTFDQFDKKFLPVATLFNGVEYEIRNGLLGLPILIQRKLY